MLYIFTTYLGIDGQPGRILNAGGIRRLIQTEELGVLTRGGVQVTKDDAGDAHHVSDRCRALGIDWRWFPATPPPTPDEPSPSPRSFGNGVTRFYAEADYQRKTVIHNTMLSLDEYLERHGPTRTGDLIRERVIVQHEGWRQYEARWRPGACPDHSHQVHLTFVVATRPFPPAACERLRQVVEEGAPPASPELFETPDEPGRYWSELRPMTFERTKTPLGV